MDQCIGVGTFVGKQVIGLVSLVFNMEKLIAHSMCYIKPYRPVDTQNKIQIVLLLYNLFTYPIINIELNI